MVPKLDQYKNEIEYLKKNYPKSNVLEYANISWKYMSTATVPFFNLYTNAIEDNKLKQDITFYIFPPHGLGTVQ